MILETHPESTVCSKTQSSLAKDDFTSEELLYTVGTNWILTGKTNSNVVQFDGKVSSELRHSKHKRFRVGAME